MQTARTRKLPPFFTQVIGSLPRPKLAAPQLWKDHAAHWVGAVDIQVERH